MISVIIPNHNEALIQQVITETESLPFVTQIVTAVDRDGRGKGWAVREALKEAEGEYIIIIDGDFDIHPRMIRRLLPFLLDYDIVLGAKIFRGTLARRILSKLTRVFFLLVYGSLLDTQTGIKAYRRDALPEWSCNSYAYDMEVVWKAIKAKRKIINVPVEVTIAKGMALKSILRTLRDAIAIRMGVLGG